MKGTGQLRSSTTQLGQEDRGAQVGSVNPNTSTRRTSYAGAVKNPSKVRTVVNAGIPPPSQSLSFVKPTIEHGRVKVLPSQGITDEGWSEWENTLVGHFVGPKLSYSAVYSIANNLWENAGLIEVLFAESDHF